MKANTSIKKMTIIAMLSAISYVLTFVFHYLNLKIVPSVSFLSYDPKDIVICIGGFILGPVASIIISVIVSLIEMLTISTTGFYGLIMNIISTCALLIPTSLIYRTKKSFKGAILALIVGFISVNIVMMLWNIIITPLYMGIDRKIVIDNYLLLIVIFNVVKTSINIAMILLFYKPIINALRSINLVNKSANDSNKKNTLLMILIGFILLLIAGLIWLLLIIFNY